MGENIALFVYTRAEQWVIASGALIRVGAMRNLTKFHWDTELENADSKFERTCS